MWTAQNPARLLHLEFSPKIVLSVVTVLETQPVLHLFCRLRTSGLAFQACVLLTCTNCDTLSFKCKFLQNLTEQAAIQCIVILLYCQGRQKCVIFKNVVSFIYSQIYCKSLAWCVCGASFMWLLSGIGILLWIITCLLICSCLGWVLFL